MLETFDRVCNAQSKQSKSIAKLNQSNLLKNDPPNQRSKSKIVSNLSKSEQRGLKSLKKRVLSGELVIGETDKSKRFCVLKRQQYIDSGLKHVKNDTIVTPAQVRTVQNNINDHCSWLKDIFQFGVNWDQLPRMANNLIDKGEGVAPLHLLIKDHKGWSEEDNPPPPPALSVMGMLE